MISFIILTYNEVRCIKRCIESIYNIANEIVIIDTGSTDDTLKILQKLKDEKIKLYKYKWKKDFSDARNFGLSKTNNDWIFYIDADEVLESLPKSEFQKKLLKLEEKYDLVNTVFYPEIVDSSEMRLIGVNRLFLKKGKFKWRGKVHEEIRKNNLPVKNAPINIKLFHDGYKEKIMIEKDKINRNKLLLTEMIEIEPKNIRWKYFMIRDSLRVWSREKSIKEIDKLRKEIKGDKRYVHENYSLLKFLIEFTIFDDNFKESLISELEELKEKNSNSLYFRSLRKLILLRKKEMEILIDLFNVRLDYVNRNYDTLHTEQYHLDFLLGLGLGIIGKKKEANLIFKELKEKYINESYIEWFNLL